MNVEIRVRGLRAAQKKLSNYQKQFPKEVGLGAERWGNDLVRKMRAWVKMNHHWKGKLESPQGIRFKWARSKGIIARSIMVWSYPFIQPMYRQAWPRLLSYITREIRRKKK